MNRPSLLGRRFGRSAILPCLIGAALVALSVPRIWLEANLLDARDMLRRLEAGDVATEAEAQPFAEHLERLARTSKAPQAYASAARAWIAAAERTDATPAERTVAIGRAATIQAEGLARAPADQFGWQRLAHTLAMRGEWIGAAQAWRLAVATGPFEPSTMPVKFQSGLALWRYMDLPQRAAFAALTETYLESEPESLVRAVNRFGGATIVRQALAGRATASAFDKALTLWPPQP